MSGVQLIRCRAASFLLRTVERVGIVELLIRVHVILITRHKLFIHLGHPKLCCRFGFLFLNGTSN